MIFNENRCSFEIIRPFDINYQYLLYKNLYNLSLNNTEYSSMISYSNKFSNKQYFKIIYLILIVSLFFFS